MESPQPSSLAIDNLAIELSNLLSDIYKKNQEIEKRTELLKTYNDSDTNKNKTEIKLNKIFEKINDLSGSSINSINYYKNEIEKAEIIYDREVKKAEAKRDEMIRKAESMYSMTVDQLNDRKNNNIKMYQDSIFRISEKLSEKHVMLKDKTNNIIHTNDIDENADKVLIRLKIEKTQLEEHYKDKKEQHAKAIQQYEKLEQLRVQSILREQQLKELEERNKALILHQQIKQQQMKSELEHQNKLNQNKSKNPIEYMTLEDKKQVAKQFNDKKKQFKIDNNSIIYDTKYDIVLDDNTDKLFNCLMKHDLEDIIELTSKKDIVSFLDQVYDMYKKKVTFEYKYDNGLYKVFTEYEINIYNNLLLLTNDSSIYKSFFDILTIPKQKKFLLKYENEYKYHFSDDD